MKSFGHTWTHQGTLGQRIADPDLLVSVLELGQEAFGDALVQEEPSGGRAALASRSDRSKDYGSKSQIEVCVR